MVGNLPIDIKAVGLTFFILALISSAMLYALAFAFYGPDISWILRSLLCGLVFSLIIMMRWTAPLRTATGKSGARE